MFNFLVGVGITAAVLILYPEFIPTVAECTQSALSSAG